MTCLAALLALSLWHDGPVLVYEGHAVDTATNAVTVHEHYVRPWHVPHGVPVGSRWTGRVVWFPGR